MKYEGIPPPLIPVMAAFSEEDKWIKFRATLECAVAIHASTANSDMFDDRASLIRASTRASVMEEQKELIPEH